MTAAASQRLARIEKAAATLGLSLTAIQVDQLSQFLDLLQRWNRTYNLTAIRDEEQMLVQHLFDCMAVVAPLAARLSSAGARLLDVGSGGGLPGVVIAICLPRVTVVCIDTVGKKAAFVTQVAGDLKLRNLRAEHGRVESLQAPPFNVVTSRAFSSLELLVRLTNKLLAVGGVWLAMKARAPIDEITALPADIEMFHVEHLQVPDLEAERCIVWMKQRSL